MGMQVYSLESILTIITRYCEQRFTGWIVVNWLWTQSSMSNLFNYLRSSNVMQYFPFSVVLSFLREQGKDSGGWLAKGHLNEQEYPFEEVIIYFFKQKNANILGENDF